MFDMPNSTSMDVVTHFSVVAQPDPGLTTRVLELFAKRGLTPNRFWGQIKCGPDPKMELDVQASDVAPEVAAHIARCMAQIFGVEKVSLAEFGGGS